MLSYRILFVKCNLEVNLMRFLKIYINNTVESFKSYKTFSLQNSCSRLRSILIEADSSIIQWTQRY